ncbi:MAG: hypothetical protein QM759_04845 [Terricaulis sp.]
MPADAIVAASSMAVCSIVSADAVNVADAHLRIADIAHLDCIATQEHHRIGVLAIATIPQGQRQFTRRALRALIGRRAPELATIALGGGGDAIVVRRARQAPAAPACFRTTRAIAAHAAINTDAIALTPCEATPSPGLDYDHVSGRLSAGGDIAQGGYLGRLDAAPAAPDIGAPLTLNIVVGPVRVQRQVTALQSGARSQRIFVRDEDGQVFRVPLGERRP